MEESTVATTSLDKEKEKEEDKKGSEAGNEARKVKVGIEPVEGDNAPIVNKGDDNNKVDEETDITSNVRLFNLEMRLKQHLKDNELPTAVKILNQLIKIEPDNMNWLFMKAELVFVLGNMKLSKTIYENILEMYPYSARAAQGLTDIYLRERNEKEIVYFLKNAITIANRNELFAESNELKFVLARAYAKSGKQKLALKVYDDIIDNDPEDCRAYLFQGILYGTLKEEDLSKSRLQQFRERCPEDFFKKSDFDDLMFSTKQERRRLMKQQMQQKRGQRALKPMTQPEFNLDIDPKSDANN